MKLETKLPLTGLRVYVVGGGGTSVTQDSKAVARHLDAPVSLASPDTAGLNHYFQDDSVALKFTAQLGSNVIGTLHGVLIVALVCIRMGGSQLSLADAFVLALKRTPIVVLVMLATIVIVSAGMTLLIIPGIWLAIRLFLVLYVALLEPEHNPFRRSWRLTRGHTLRTALILLMTVIMIGLMKGFVAVMTSLTPTFWGSALIMATADGLLANALPTILGLLAFGWFRIERLHWHPPVAA